MEGRGRTVCRGSRRRRSGTRTSARAARARHGLACRAARRVSCPRPASRVACARRPRLPRRARLLGLHCRSAFSILANGYGRMALRPSLLDMVDQAACDGLAAGPLPLLALRVRLAVRKQLVKLDVAVVVVDVDLDVVVKQVAVADGQVELAGGVAYAGPAVEAGRSPADPGSRGGHPRSE